VRAILSKPCHVEARGEFTGDRLIVDKAVGVCGADGRFVEMFSVQDAAFNTRDLSPYERGTVFEILQTILRPHFELPMVCGQADILRSRDHDEFCSGLARSNAARMHLSKPSSSTGFCK